MKKNSFFAMMGRMKYITRWGLMRNTLRESLSEHSFETAVIAHALAVIGKERYGRAVDPGEIAAAALFHDAPEILT
ncbi:MAG: HD domain-containing protein, partial [Clostridia bacterium]|nr:HD domain-containing protein [Clostridia bacterium]